MATKLAWLGLAVLALTQIAFAGGNIAITGHDDDLHAAGCESFTAASAQLSAMIAFARSGAPNPSLPLLSFDHGKQLTDCLTKLGIPFANIDPDAGVPAATVFDVTKYSAMVVASNSSCGGCDNTDASIANLKAASEAIGAFLNRGGGIVAFAGAGNAATYYQFLPASASGFGNPPDSGYGQTSFGALIGIPPVDGNPTHNFFPNPGTPGVSASYDVVEKLNSDGTAETLACRDCTTTGLISGKRSWWPDLKLSFFPPASDLLAVAAGVAILKGVRSHNEKNRQRGLQERGFTMRINGAIEGGAASGYDLEIRGSRDARPGNGRWEG